MSESLAISLRDRIFSRVSESDGCYLWIYSGIGEKASFLSNLLARRRNDHSIRVLIDLDHRPCGYRSDNSSSYTLTDAVTEKRTAESLESFCLRVIREKLRMFSGRRTKGSRILVVVDCSSFLADAQKPLADGGLSFHKRIIDLVHSTKGGTGVLLYSIDCLNERMIPKLLEFHSLPRNSPKVPSLQAISNEFQKSLKEPAGAPEIKVYGEGVMFIDPASSSAAFLTPISAAIRKALPYDPLSILHRNIAFANNFTVHEGACPYLCADVPSRCLLDPRVVKAVRTKGQSFVRGRTCITAIDHMVLEQTPDEKTIQKHADVSEEANLDEDLNYSDDTDDALETSRGSHIKGDPEMKLKKVSRVDSESASRPLVF